MVSSNEEFDPNSLLIDGDDPLEGERLTIHIEVEEVIDDDGDEALRLHLDSYGLSDEGLASVLALALQSLIWTGEDDDDDEDY